RIHNQSKTTAYRDGEGRIRRDGPDQITIWDPVAGVSYFLDPQAQTARKVPVGIVTATAKQAGTVTVTTSNTMSKTTEKLAAEKMQIDRLAMPNGLSSVTVYTRRATGAAGNKES